jgi:hypothetical protein
MASPSERLYSDPVPGGSLIGSVDSKFAAQAYTLYSAKQPKNKATRINHLTHDSLSSSLPSDTSQLEPSLDPLNGIIDCLSRSKIEALVTAAWIRNIPNQSEAKLRDLVIGAVNKGILNQEDIQSTFTNTFSGLPTHVNLPLQSDGSNCRFNFRSWGICLFDNRLFSLLR